jgi:hypothetical protein
MFTIVEVTLTTPIEAIVSRPGIRVNCDVCGEEIMNERETHHEGLILCRACAGHSYYRLPYAVARDVSRQGSGMNVTVQSLSASIHQGNDR